MKAKKTVFIAAAAALVMVFALINYIRIYTA